MATSIASIASQHFSIPPSSKGILMHIWMIQLVKHPQISDPPSFLGDVKICRFHKFSPRVFSHAATSLHPSQGH